MGRALVRELSTEHDVVALSRRGSAIPGARSVAVDVGDEAAVVDALAGCRVAYYLVHSLDSVDFRARDRRLAETFGRAARAAGVERIVYLGGLGADPTSEHLASRQEVGVALAQSGVDVVELRAAVVLGSGSISFEMLRSLTERLPFMVCPRWVHTAIQPIAERDLLAHLVRALDVPPGVYEVGGAEATTYRDMIVAYAEVRGLRSRLVIDVPLLTPRLSSYWVDLVTPVDATVSHALIESLRTEVVVTDPGRTRAAFGLETMPIRAAIRAALDDQATAIEGQALFARERGLKDGVYTERVEVPIREVDAAALDADLDRVGGDLDWYGLPAAWRVRIALGRLVGERWRLDRPTRIESGETVDWWTVVRRVPRELVLRGVGWFFGEGWLAFRVDAERLVEVGILRPKGLPGFLYWKALHPVHRWVFARLARHRVERAALRDWPPRRTRGEVR